MATTETEQVKIEILNSEKYFIIPKIGMHLMLFAEAIELYCGTISINIKQTNDFNYFKIKLRSLDESTNNMILNYINTNLPKD